MLKKLMRSKLLWLVVFLVVLRAVAPIILLHQINRYLADFSPNYYGKVEDFRMSLWRGAYGLEGLTLTLREKPITFLSVEDIDVSIAWREIFRGRIKTDIDVRSPKLVYSDYVVGQLSKKTGEVVDNAKDAGNTLFPVSVERVRILSGAVDTADFFGVTEKLPMIVTQVEGELTNLTPNEKNQISRFNISALLPDQAPIKLSGLYNQTLDPIDWEVKAHVKDFTLKTANPWTYHIAPLTATRGHLSAFAEAKSTAGKMEGYVKPFMKNAAFVGDDKDFKGLTQFGIELSVAGLNRLFRDSKDKTAAAKIDFKYENETFSWNMWDVLKSLFKNGYVERLEEDFEKS